MPKVIRVKFSQSTGSEMQVSENARVLSSKEYDYFMVSSEQESQLKEGSLAIVDVAGVLRIVVIVGVLAHSSRATKHAICIFNLEDHRRLLRIEDQKTSLRDAIEARAKESRRQAELQALAASDTVLAEMLAELNALEGNSSQ